MRERSSGADSSEDVTVSGVVVLCRPENIGAVTEVLAELPWAEVHHVDPTGRLVVTIEASDAEQSMSHMGHLQTLPGVLNASLGTVYLDRNP